MRYSICLLVALLPLTVSSCRKEQPSEPEPSGDGSSSTVTISPAGGELRAEGFVLIVPPGAFATTAELQLTALPTDRPFGTNSVSGSYRIDGFPAEFSEPVTVYIKRDGTGGPASSLAAGAEATFSTAEGMNVIYSFHSAVDSAGYLVGQLEPTASGGAFHQPAQGRGRFGAQFEGTFSIYLNAVSGYAGTQIEDPHYRFLFPSGIDTNLVVLLLETFAEVVQKLKPVLSHEELKSYGCPVPVSVLPFGASSGVYAAWGHSLLHLYGALWINEDRLGELTSTEMKMQLGESIWLDLAFHRTFDAPTARAEDFWSSERFWFHVACATWTNTLFLPTGGVPRNFAGREYAPFNGLLPATEDMSNARLHGYGMSAFIQYLVDWSSVGVIKGIYQRLSAGQSLTAAIPQASGRLIGDIWALFFYDYLRGVIFNYDIGLLLDEKKGSFTIATESDSLRLFPDLFRHLAAKLYLVNLVFDPVNPGFLLTTSLTLKIHSASMGAQLLAFGYSGDALVFLGRSGRYPEDSIAVGNVVELRSLGFSSIVAAVVSCQSDNPASGSVGIDLEARLQRKVELVWNRADMGLYGFKARMKYVVGGEEQEYTSTPNLVQEATGQFEGTTFEGKMTDRAENGTFSITFHPERHFVTAFGFEYQYDDGDNWGHFRLSGGNVTLEHYWFRQEDQEIEFRLSGAEIKDQGTECLMNWGRRSSEEESTLLSWDSEPETDLKIRLYRNP